MCTQIQNDASARWLLTECGHETLNIRKIREAIFGHFEDHLANPIKYQNKCATRWARGCVDIPPSHAAGGREKP